jgi:hypothetical protein
MVVGFGGLVLVGWLVGFGFGFGWSIRGSCVFLCV